MKYRTTTRKTFARSAIALAMLALPAFALVAEDQTIFKPDGKSADQTKKVKVFILMGQSNMVGMGDIQGGSSGSRDALQKTVMSVHEGAYSPEADYDKLAPVSTIDVPIDKDWTSPAADKSAPKTYVLRGQRKDREHPSFLARGGGLPERSGIPLQSECRDLHGSRPLARPGDGRTAE